tara:strand:+ start:87395 stop:88462 length:1068 start_codon:yes stop_codon:yes gene_type:complete
MINRGATLVSHLVVVITILLNLTACGGGGGGDGFYDKDNTSSGPVFYDNGSSGSNPAQLTLGFSDALPEDLKQVVIEVDSITFRSVEAADVVVDNFTISELNLVNAPTFQVDLLKYPGISQLLVIEGFELATGLYTEVSITILTGGVNQSYVQQDDDTFRAIEQPSGVLTLPGMQLASGAQRFTVEFGLAQALQYQASTGNYLLTTNGLRIENDQTAATLSGSIDSSLFNSVLPCSEKIDPQSGNRAYLYEGISLLPENLADVFTLESTTAIPANAIAPFAVASIAENTLTGSWNYSFGYIPAGSYTIAFACNTATDDSVEYNSLVIPLPANQTYEISLSESQNGVCKLSTEGNC